MAPKVFGGGHLDRLTKDLPLEFFVIYASVAGVFGSRGQANHAAANTYLDALAHRLHARGRRALSIDWGVWSDVGAAVRHGVEKRAGDQGIGTIDPVRGLETLEQLMLEGLTQAVVFPVQWDRYASQLSDGRRSPFLSLVLPSADKRSGAAKKAVARDSVPDLLRQLDATPVNSRPKVLLSHVRDQAARVLALPASRPLDPRQPLNEVGLDSLMAVELRNVLSASIGRPLPATLLFDYPTVDALAAFLGRDLLGTAQAEEPVAATVPGGVIERIEDLSDEEVDRMFAERMARKQQS